MMKLTNTYLGFTRNFTPMQKTKVETLLDKYIRSEGIIYTNKDFILTRLQEGYSPVMQENYSYYSSKLQDYTKSKTRYTLQLKEEKTTSLYEIEKTLYNFALYLQENNLLNEENINRVITQEVTEAEAERKAIEEKELKERQEKERQEQEQKNFENWIDREVETFQDIEKFSLAKNIFLSELNQYNEYSLKKFIVLIYNIDNPKCREELVSWLHVGNKTSKKVFYHLTGIKLPTTDKETKEILRNTILNDFTGSIEYKKRKERGEAQQDIFYKLITIPEVNFQECYGEYVKKYDLELFICKEVHKYTISHIASGILLTSGETKEELFNNLKSAIDNMGIETIKNRLNEFMEKYGSSPKVKAA